MTKYFDDVLHLYINNFNQGKLNPSIFLENYLHRWNYILRQTTKALISFKRNNVNPTTSQWLFIVSENNYRSLEFLLRHDRNFCFVSHSEIVDKEITIPFRPQLTDIFNFWIFSYLKVILFGTNRLFYLKFPHLFFTSYRFRIQAKRTLDTHKPEIIIFSNDINYVARILNLEARKNGIPTVYIQHATVSELFPPLNFTLALLEGQYSLDIYDIEPGTKVEIIGQPKFESYKPLRKQVKSTRVIGVAFNTVDDLDEVLKLCMFLSKNDFQTYIRPHPREKRREFQQWECLDYISGNQENSFDFILKCDLVIGADSSIHLEAALLNVPSIYYNMNNNFSNDYYQFVKNGMIPKAKDKFQLLDLIKKLDQTDKSTIYKKAKYYCNSTDSEINSELEAYHKIECLLNS